MSTNLRAAQKLVPVTMGLITGAILSGLAIYLGKLLVEEAKIALGDYIQVFILIFIAATMGVAIWTQRRKEQFDASATYLENAISLVEKAQSVIRDKQGKPINNRVSWVTAARLIIRAEYTAAKISEQVHKAIYEAEHDFFRHQFWSFLKHGNQSLSASFFCGASDPSLSIGDAVFEQDQKKDGGKWIPPRIVSVIYRYFQYPEAYEDPLANAKKLTTREKDMLRLFGQRGVCDYFTFRDNFVPVSQKIFKKNGVSKPIEVDAQQITDEMSLLSGVSG